MNKQKRIGVLCHKQADSSISISAAYAAWADHFGTIVPVFALDDKVREDIDVLVLIGGADVDAGRYSTKLHFATQNPNAQLEWFDTQMLPQYIEQNKKIFGICRGFQTLNVTLGGRLDQHIFQAYSNPRTELVDKISLTQEGLNWLVRGGILTSIMQDMPKNQRQDINSLHHQGFFPKHAGSGVISLFINDKQNNVEAFMVQGKPICAVQYHPEEIYDQLSTNMMNYLLNL